MSTNGKRKLLVVTSTFPRWKDDSSPTFVADFVKSISSQFSHIRVIAPHADKAKHNEAISHSIHVRRYRYMAPASAQTVAYDGGAHNKVSKNPVYLVKLGLLLASQFIHMFYYTLFQGYRIINAHWLIPQGFLAVLLKMCFFGKLRIIITVHGSDVLKLDGSFLRRVKRFTLKRADVVVVNSSITLSKCRDIYKRKYEIIPMGIDVGSYSEGDENRIKKMYALDGFFTILFVGRFSKEKGIVYLCDALLNLSKKRNLAFKAILVGDGPEHEYIKKFIRKHALEDTIITPGWVSQYEIKDYYAAADVFIGPSIREALGLVFIEALASGTPIIATNVGGIKDVLIESVNGFTIKSHSADEIGQKIEILMRDRNLLKKLTTGARNSIVENYSWDSVSRRYGKIMS